MCTHRQFQRTCAVNVFTLAAAADFRPAHNSDPTISALLGDIRSSLTGVNAIIQQTGNPDIQQATFFNIGGQTRRFPTVRFDFKLTDKHHIENIWNYQQFTSVVDFLNGVDPVFPGFPNFGSQDSNRFSNTTAWRWTINNNLVDEARFGLTGGTVLFFPQVNQTSLRTRAASASASMRRHQFRNRHDGPSTPQQSSQAVYGQLELGTRQSLHQLRRQLHSRELLAARDGGADNQLRHQLDSGGDHPHSPHLLRWRQASTSRQCRGTLLDVGWTHLVNHAQCALE